jgi:hypothetical protein
MPNGRCRMHGGVSTGPRTAEGLERSRRARWRHGHYSAEAKAVLQRRRVAEAPGEQACRVVERAELLARLEGQDAGEGPAPVHRHDGRIGWGREVKGSLARRGNLGLTLPPYRRDGPRTSSLPTGTTRTR